MDGVHMHSGLLPCCHLFNLKSKKDLQVHTHTRSGMPTSPTDTSLRSCALLTTRLLSSFALFSAAVPDEVGFSWVGAESCSPTLLSETESENEKQSLTEVLLAAPKQKTSEQSS